MALEDKYLTPQEIADKLKINSRTVQRIISRGEIEAVKVGRQYRITEGSFARYLERNSVNRE